MSDDLFVKICGITSEADALLSVSLGASAVGFMFAPSPRQISVQLAGDIAKRLPEDVLTVGVFRDEAPQRVVEAVHSAGLGAARSGPSMRGRRRRSPTRWPPDSVTCGSAFLQASRMGVITRGPKPVA